MSQTDHSGDVVDHANVRPRPRRWFRWLALVVMIALGLFAWRDHVQQRTWRKFSDEVESAGGSASESPVLHEAFLNLPIDWLPESMWGRFPFGRTIRHLALDSDRIDDDWLQKHIQSMRDSRVAVVRITSESVTDAGLEVFRNHPGVESLVLNNSRFSSDCLSKLGNSPNLANLCVFQVQLSAESSRQLAGFSKLNHLSCEGQSPGLGEIGGHKQLRILFLTHASDESISRLSPDCAAEMLLLSGDTITDACIPDLIRLKNLREFCIDSPHITDEGLAKLKNAGINAVRNPPP